MTLTKKIVTFLLILLFLCTCSAGVYGFGIVSSITSGQMDEAELSINSLLDESSVNIALFGIDGREGLDSDRSDTIMIVSANFETGEIKVVSVLRDLLAQIPEGENNGRYLEKINAAYSIGGVELAVKALNENFDLNIQDYIIVDFSCMVHAVNALGGVEINIQSEEILEETNKWIWEGNWVAGVDEPHIGGTGIQNLTGVQALSYCRNRAVGSDFGRAERQREVFTVLAKKAMDMDLMTAISLLGQIYPYVTTSLSLPEITTYLQTFLGLENKTIQTAQLPFDEVFTTGMIGNISYVKPADMEDNVKILHGLLYGEENYQASDTVLDINSRIVNYSGVGSWVDWSTETYHYYLKTPEEKEAEENAAEAENQDVSTDDDTN